MGRKKITRPATEEELILGKSTPTKEVEITDCFNKEKLYEVTNLEVQNNASVMNGVMVKNLFGYYSKDEQMALEEGAKEVIIMNTKKTKNIYKIKVLN